MSRLTMMYRVLAPLFASLAMVAVSAVGMANDDVSDGFDGPWRLTLKQPAEGWQEAGFDDSAWQKAYGGFGTLDTPAARVGTVWETPDIWLRREIQLTAIPAKPALLIHHDDDTEVYLNGQQVATFTKWSTEYQVVPLSVEGRKSLKVGKNLLAVHTHQLEGGQFIDVHLVDADQVPELPPARLPAEPYQSPLITAWGKNLTADNVWEEYPRPQMTRDNWDNLNGLWNYAITSENQDNIPEEWAGQILVPFAIESKLSGVGRLLRPSEALWYHRGVELQPTEGKRTLLNFEAVDYACRVYVNGLEVGSHVGGNTPFSIDVTEAAKTGLNDLVVRVEDKTGGYQLRGKQTLRPEGIWYTRVSGIWQTVWVEQVPESYIADIVLLTDPETGTIQIKPVVKGDGAAKVGLQATAYYDGQLVANQTVPGESVMLEIPDPLLWSPQSPNLYDITVAILGEDGRPIDAVGTYAGIRSVGTVRDENGDVRFTLNGQEIFHWGTLDQGWWPDGLLTPPSDEAMKSDINYLKAAGFNMIRKHIKVEPRRYYYHCDRLGMMVWQDQVSGGPSPKWTFLKPNPADASWSDEAHAQFLREFDEMVDTLENHPSIVVWVPFNEAWGQHRTIEVGEWIMRRDPTRLVNIASGGNFWPVGHIADRHNYPQPDFPLEQERFVDMVKVIGEFGGHGWPVEGHLWKKTPANWGYGGLPKTIEQYVARYQESIDILAGLKARGIAGAVYTQTTDVESEVNGLITYDREEVKISAEQLRTIHAPLVAPRVPLP